MQQLFAIAAGGAGGALFRFWTSNAVYQWLGRGFPYGTLAVNLIGSFLMGLLTHLFLERLSLTPEWRAAVLIGFLGSFTTFSTFSLETLNLLNNGEMLKALLNVTISICVCLLAVWAGFLVGRQW